METIFRQEMKESTDETIQLVCFLTSFEDMLRQWWSNIINNGKGLTIGPSNTRKNKITSILQNTENDTGRCDLCNVENTLDITIMQHMFNIQTRGHQDAAPKKLINTGYTEDYIFFIETIDRSKQLPDEDSGRKIRGTT